MNGNVIITVQNEEYFQLDMFRLPFVGRKAD